MTSNFGDDEALDRRLLAILIDKPRRMLQLAIATGMAIGLELQLRGARPELERMAVNESLCLAACRVVLERWASAARAGGLTEAEFEAMLDEIVRIARAS